jgi:peroxiredoxin
MLSACGDKADAPAVGQPAPDFALPDLEGRIFRLSEQRGKVVLINFWASWCPPCVEEMPSLLKLHQELEGQGLEVVAVSVDDTLDIIKEFKQEHGLSFTILHDEGAKVSHQYQTFMYPESYVVDVEGILKWKVVGPRDWLAPNVMVNVVALAKKASSQVTP